MECRVELEPVRLEVQMGEMVCPRAYLVSDCNRFASRNHKEASSRAGSIEIRSAITTYIRDI